mgnify:CR=1 FL=1
MNFVSLITYDKIPGQPDERAGHYNLRNEIPGPIYTQWFQNPEEIIYLHTLKNTEKNRQKLQVERTERLYKGEKVFVLLHAYKPDDKRYGENRAGRRWRGRWVARLLRKLARRQKPLDTQQAAVDAALEDERRRRKEMGLALPGTEEFAKTQKRMRKPRG